MILGYVGLDPSLRNIMRLYDFILTVTWRFLGLKWLPCNLIKMFHLVGFKENNLIFNFKI